MKNTKSLIFILALLILINSCGERKGKKNPSVGTEVTSERIFIPDFNADSAWLFVDKQVAFGPRVPNTEAHRKCADWLTATLERFDAEVIVQQVKLRASNGTMLDVRNIIASYNPENKSRILLCAHWDSRPWADYDPDPANRRKPLPGANDGASGVGVLLEIARQFSSHNPGHGVDIILFDAEDYGDHKDDQGNNDHSWALGSQHWARNPHVPGYSARFGILLDMVGAENASFTMEGTSMYYAPGIMRKVWDVAHNLGYQNFFLNRKTGPITDDHLYINEIIRIPTIDIIDYDPDREKGFFDQWHTVNDDMQNISKETLKAVGQTVLAVVYTTK
ncbi:MAG: M28 family peptidase [Lentimicrobium sp.]|nr:M28 family peptidase [Lentimicrobium sp.]